MAARYCIRCGKQLHDNARFCAYCGAPVPDFPEDPGSADEQKTSVIAPLDPSSESEAQKTSVLPSASLTQPSSSNSPSAHEDETMVIGAVPLSATAAAFSRDNAPAIPRVEPDLTGFDVEVEPAYDSSVLDMGNWDDLSWSSERPAGWTGGMSAQATMQMPGMVDPAARMRGGTDQMGPAHAPRVEYATPQQTVFAAEEPRKSHAKVIVGIIVAVAAIGFTTYFLTTNPYVFQNIETMLADRFGSTLATTLSAIFRGAQIVLTEVGKIIFGSLSHAFG
ncbi:zinc ribbon domain-containing protein [Curtanaerobium respiraculi]|uniref:zinc ribbon domain-containing protein n=1 Tax=Curtanaerobium respiraculi TaxID=2949669 RepID=UPI0024B36DD0|nr:zinc ribbon domain-containing protein [Curtanaerobium respiraculi]